MRVHDGSQQKPPFATTPARTVKPCNVKALIKVGYGCNNHCSFCHTAELRHIEDTVENVHRKIERASQLGHTMVVLSGGEPTMRPRLVTWAQHSALRGMDFGLVTNGRMLSYPALVDRLAKYRLAYVYMSLHGGTAKIHNAMVRAPCFEETFGAVGVLSGRGLDLTVNCVVTRTNVEHLNALVDLLAGYDDLTLKFSMAQPKGAAGHRFDAVIAPVSQVAERVNAAIAYGKSIGAAPRFAHDGIPFCLLDDGHEHIYDDLKTHGFATMIEVDEPDFFPVDDVAKVHTEACFGCSLRGACPGLYRPYFDQHSDAELKPRRGPRSNAFHYVHERDVAWPEGAPCPVAFSVSPYDRGRQLFVLEGERMGVYRTHTRDFSDEEIGQVKWAAAQLYLDASDKPAVDDFSADLQLLRQTEVCTACPVAAGCARCFEAAPGDVFGQAERQVLGLLEGLEGDVLDVGCGEGRVTEVLAARKQQMRYTAVEPDAERAAAFQAAHPWATVDARRIEDVAVEPQSLDHVLILRSWNHLERPADVLSKLMAGLRPGGRMLIVDNVAFALVRTPAQADRAEGSDAAFEHFRNDTVADARAVAETAGLVTVESTPVMPGGSNQWVLQLRRPALESV